MVTAHLEEVRGDDAAGEVHDAETAFRDDETVVREEERAAGHVDRGGFGRGGACVKVEDLRVDHLGRSADVQRHDLLRTHGETIVAIVSDVDRTAGEVDDRMTFGIILTADAPASVQIQRSAFDRDGRIAVRVHVSRRDGVACRDDREIFRRVLNADDVCIRRNGAGLPVRAGAPVGVRVPGPVLRRAPGGRKPSEDGRDGKCGNCGDSFTGHHTVTKHGRQIQHGSFHVSTTKKFFRP